MVRLFAQTSGDRNLYHLDDEFITQEFARGAIKFDGRIAHGILTLLVSLVGLQRVTDGCHILGVEEVRYRAPVRIGDSVTPIFTVVDVHDHRIRLRVEALRRDGQVAMEGTVVVTPHEVFGPSDGARPPEPARLRAARARSATVTAFPRDKQAPAFPQGRTVSQDFEATISSEVADGYWALTGPAGSSLWNVAVGLGMIAHTSAHFASPGWILLSTKLEEQKEPIRQGDTLTSNARLEITRLTREGRRPICRIVMDIRNQHDRPVFRAEVAKLGDAGLCCEGA